MGWNKELLYQLVENVKDYAIYVSDTDGRIVSWNAGGEVIFGYTAQEALGQHGRILFTPEDRAALEPEKELEKARNTGSAEDERWHIRKDGSLFFASGVQMRLVDENGNHTGYAKIVRDLTERINFQEELRTAKENLESNVSERTSELYRKNEELHLEIVSRKESENLRVALLRRIVTAQEDERKRIARDIHDNIGQAITALKLKLKAIEEQAKEVAELSEQLAHAQEIADRVDSEVDFLAWELRPSVLDDFGLRRALEVYVRDWSQHFNIPAQYQIVGLDDKRLVPEIEINLYRIAQEALNNVVKHAAAKNVSVLLERRDNEIILIVEDDGKGFEPGNINSVEEDDRGMGILGMKERASLAGGGLDIESSPGKGTTIYVRATAHFNDEEI